MPSRFLRLRLWLEQNGLFPRGRLAIITTYLFALDILLFTLQKIIATFHPSSAGYLSGWVIALTLITLVLLLRLIERRISAKLLWRMRNRLIVTYKALSTSPMLAAHGACALEITARGPQRRRLDRSMHRSAWAWIARRLWPGRIAW